VAINGCVQVDAGNKHCIARRCESLPVAAAAAAAEVVIRLRRQDANTASVA